MMLRPAAALCAALALCAPAAALAAGAAAAERAPADAKAAPAACAAWPAWEGFRDRYVEQGRVVDPADAARYTTSEGQSYAMLFALAANSRADFDRLLRWTEDNLAGGDLSARLPAWQWGKRADGSWGVADTNAASDADLWIAYALEQAARLWREPKYAARARLLADRILREETVALPGFGRTLLPGPVGFKHGDTVRLNPSYLPLQVLRGLATAYPDSDWKAILKTTPDLLLRSAPAGYAPDWVRYSGNRFQADEETKASGSYNAIRVYLWAGMLPADDPARAQLLAHFAPMAKQTAAAGVPPEAVDTRSGKVVDATGPAGFSASMLPFLAASRMDDAARQQRLRLEAKAPLERSDNYYDQVLTLFSTGWSEGRIRFARDGSLKVNWPCATN